MTQAKVYINGSCYVSTTEDNRCGNCHINIYENYTDCVKTYDAHRSCSGIIWIKQQPIETQSTNCNQTKGEPEMNTANKPTEVTTEEPKYTLAEFLKACDDWYGSEYCDSEDRYKNFKQFLERESNQEYQEYLRLKAIYS